VRLKRALQPAPIVGVVEVVRQLGPLLGVVWCSTGVPSLTRPMTMAQARSSSMFDHLASATTRRRLLELAVHEVAAECVGLRRVRVVDQDQAQSGRDPRRCGLTFGALLAEILLGEQRVADAGRSSQVLDGLTISGALMRRRMMPFSIVRTGPIRKRNVPHPLFGVAVQAEAEGPAPAPRA
jgi:hypothetical protein